MKIKMEQIAINCKKQVRRFSITISLTILCFVGLYSQFTPLAWQSPDPLKWSRDTNENRIDDLIEARSPSELIDVVFDLNRCITNEEAKQFLLPLSSGDILWLNPEITFVFVEKVRVDSITGFFSSGNGLVGAVAMIELAAGFGPSTDISMQAIKVSSGQYWSVDDQFSNAIRGQGINIAILDSGVNDNHDAFKGKLVSIYNAITNDDMTNPDDDTGHGTWVAGVALGRILSIDGREFRGVAPDAGLIDVKVIDPDNTCSTSEQGWLHLAQGLSWVYTNNQNDETPNIDIINLSLEQCMDENGTVVTSNGLDAMSQYIDLLHNEGIVVVGAIGNNSQSGSLLPVPGCADQIITVTAAQDNTITRTPTITDDQIYAPANRGPRASDNDSDTIDEQKPDITAPGVNIVAPNYLTMNGFVEVSGTSLAAPHVSGVAALILQRYPGIGPAMVKDLILQSADDPATDMQRDPIMWDSDWGFGMLNALEAIQSAPTVDVRFATAGDADMYWSDAIQTATTPVVGVQNTISAEIINNGGSIANNVTVNFGVYQFSATGQTNYHIGSQSVAMLPPGVSRTVHQSWTPASTEDILHANIEVEIVYGLDSEPANNLAQKNVMFSPTESPATIPFVVDNPTLDTATISVTKVHEVIPSGWTFTYHPKTFELAPQDCAETVTATFTPPSNATACDSAYVDLIAIISATNDTIGGLRVGAFVPDSVLCPIITSNLTIAPKELEPVLYLPFPNPGHSEIRIPFEIPHSRRVQIGVYNIYGYQVAQLADTKMLAGKQEVHWKCAEAPPGIYFVQLTYEGRTLSRKVLVE